MFSDLNPVVRWNFLLSAIPNWMTEPLRDFGNPQLCDEFDTDIIFRGEDTYAMSTTTGSLTLQRHANFRTRTICVLFDSRMIFCRPHAWVPGTDSASYTIFGQVEFVKHGAKDGEDSHPGFPLVLQSSGELLLLIALGSQAGGSAFLSCDPVRNGTDLPTEVCRTWRNAIETRLETARFSYTIMYNHILIVAVCSLSFKC